VKKLNSDMPTDCNYLDLATGEFVFNKYKTAKKYQQQREKISDDLKAILAMYLKHHPIYKDKTKQKEPVPLLCTYDGKPFTASNSITRILNKIFGKRVGSSMIRHAFISSKYGKVMDEMKRDSEAMGHSLEEQRAYYKKSDTTDDIITHE
jgi:integrase